MAMWSGAGLVSHRVHLAFLPIGEEPQLQVPNISSGLSHGACLSLSWQKAEEESLLRVPEIATRGDTAPP